MEELTIQGLGIAELAERYGTPMYVYDGDVLRRQYLSLRERLHPAMEVFYSLKANPNISICALLASLGVRAEVSSLVELITARQAGVPGEDIIFLGPGKSEGELAACLDEDVYAVICESFGELELLDRIAASRGRAVPVALRVNPAFTVKGAGLTMGGRPRQFGIDADQLFACAGLVRDLPHLRFIGVQAYLGTRILSHDVVVDNTVRIFELAGRFAAHLGFPLQFVDVGGGLGVAYFAGELDLDIDLLTARLNPAIEAFAHAHPGTRVAMELGRYLTATAGTYLVRVRYVKTSMGECFAVTDGGMNHHLTAVGVESPVKRNFPIQAVGRLNEPPSQTWQVCGPLCTPSDTIGRNVALPALAPGDLIGVLRAGAYGPSASPGLFLSHGFPAEVLVDAGEHHLIRERDTPADLLRPQRLVHHSRRAP
jgi:diaminopimelate decarboxylase